MGNDSDYLSILSLRRSIAAVEVSSEYMASRTANRYALSLHTADGFACSFFEDSKIEVDIAACDCGRLSRDLEVETCLSQSPKVRSTTEDKNLNNCDFEPGSSKQLLDIVPLSRTESRYRMSTFSTKYWSRKRTLKICLLGHKKEIETS